MGLEERERLDSQLGELPPSPAVPLGRHLLSEHVGRQYGRGVNTGPWHWMTLGSHLGSATSCG